MAQSKITLIGMENFLNPDHSVFEQLDLPEDIDKDTLIGSIILRCQEFELLYSDPDFMISAVKIWGMKHYWTFDRWIKVINEEYDPLYNKDYHEEYTDTHGGQYSKTGSGSSSGNTSENSDFTRTDNLATTNDVTETHSEKAYNDSNYVGKSQDVTDQDTSQTGTVRNAGTNTGQYGNRNSTSESGGDSFTNTHNYHGYGNIGIMSSQALVRDEISTVKWSIYEAIADLFCEEFCIMVY